LSFTELCRYLILTNAAIYYPLVVVVYINAEISARNSSPLSRHRTQILSIAVVLHRS